MECTQRIECTQELCQNLQERIFPEEIGFLGICGTQYPIRKGPNKIGRDPGICEIVLNLNSVSRQHAVINILNSKDYMIMDLGSANKTKLLEKTLQPYIPHPLRNGDTVQFGHIFGVFRLLEDGNDLPMTQVLDIPDTPVVNKHASKLFNLPGTVIPESPDVSDKDDSFVAPSQPKNYDFKSPSQNYIKSFGKTIAIKPIGSKQIDNIYWSSSKTSIDMDLDDSDISFPLKHAAVDENIHEMETQIPFPPSENDPDDTYSANTLCDNLHSNKINLKANIEKTTGSEEQLEIYDNKENNYSINNSDTQHVIITDREETRKNNSTGNVSVDGEETSKANLSVSEEVIHFAEVDMEPLDEDFASQPLLLSETVNDTINIPNSNGKKSTDKEIKIVDDDNKSEVSTDCDDMVVTQKIPYVNPNMAPTDEIMNHKISFNKKDTSDDSTDCEDDLFDNNDKFNVSHNVTLPSNTDTDTLKAVLTKTNTTAQNANKTSEIDSLKDQTSENSYFEDMLTQVVEVVNNQNVVDSLKNTEDSSFEDLPTQVITVTTKQVFKPNEICDEKSPFKIPFKSVNSKKRKEFTNNSLIKSIKHFSNVCDNDENNFYTATQDIYKDLCSQSEISTEKRSSNIDSGNARLPSGSDINGDKSMRKPQIVEMDIANELGLTKQNIAGSASSSDVETTPDNSHKNITFMITEPPNSQEILKSISFNPKQLVLDSFSDSEDNMSENNTPILFHKRKRTKNAKLDLTKKFDLESLPTRTITRNRKPSAKVENSEIKNALKNILAPKIFGDQDEGVDKEIIAANISRIKNTKNKEEKKKSHQNDATKPAQSKKDHTVESEKIDKAEIKSVDQNPKNSRTETKPLIDEGNKSKSKINKNNNYYLNSTKQGHIPESSKTDTSKLRSTRIKPINDKSKPRKEIIKVAILKPKGKRSYEEEVQDKSTEKEVRRSKRQKIKKEQETEVRNTKKTRSNKIQNEATNYEREKSIIYRLSDESMASSRNDKSLEENIRSYLHEPEATSGTGRRSLRRTASKNTKHTVLFTAFSHPDMNVLYNLLEKLNAVVVTDVKACSVVVTVELKRTFKLLCAVGLGKPIVGKTWIQACRDTNMIVDPWQYLLKDGSREARYNFDLARTLTGKRDFLKGYNVSSTPKVEPQANEMKLIVECSGGTWKEGGSPWVCISTIQDKALWPSLKRRGAILVNPEFILGGVLRQKVELEKNRLI